MRLRATRRFLAILSLAALGFSARADVKLPAILSDNMCLQAAKPLPIWGTAAPDEAVTVTLGEQKQATTAGKDGKWMVKLNALAAGGPLEMTVAGKNTITVKNILVGEVWVASGQSNMEFSFGGAHNVAVEKPRANYPKIRIFNLQKKIAFEPQADCVGKWEECSPETVVRTSAVGYFFIRDIHNALGVPCGLIHTSWGGTPAEAWTSVEDLEANPELKGLGDRFLKIHDDPAAAKAKYETEALPKWEADTQKYKVAMAEWQAAAKAAQAAGTPARPQPRAPQAPRKPAAPDKDPNLSTVLYNGMIAPIVNYAIGGAIWYQGESNAGNPRLYRTLFPAMITDWRKHWSEVNPGEGNFPFLWVQLANYMPKTDQPVQDAGNWPGLREAQHITLSLPNTGEAVIIDVGQADDIHPKDKMDVGHRLALGALKVAYGKTDIVYSGPTYQSMTVEGDKIRVKFANIGGGLITAAAPSTQPVLSESKGDALMPFGVPGPRPLIGFSIAGEDQKFVWAKAKIEGDSVLVWSDEVKNPVAVRYAWANNPNCDLYNKEGLPASPFRTDAWGK